MEVQKGEDLAQGHTAERESLEVMRPKALLATCHHVEQGSGPGPGDRGREWGRTGGTDSPHKVLFSILSSPLMCPHSKKPTVRQRGSRATLYLTG